MTRCHCCAEQRSSIGKICRARSRNAPNSSLRCRCDEYCLLECVRFLILILNLLFTYLAFALSIVTRLQANERSASAAKQQAGKDGGADAGATDAKVAGQKTPVVLCVFIGGCTYGEVRCLQGSIHVSRVIRNIQRVV